MRVELRGSYSSMLESGKKDERLNYGSSKGNEGWPWGELWQKQGIFRKQDT